MPACAERSRRRRVVRGHAGVKSPSPCCGAALAGWPVVGWLMSVRSCKEAAGGAPAASPYSISLIGGAARAPMGGDPKPSDLAVQKGRPASGDVRRHIGNACHCLLGRAMPPTMPNKTGSATICRRLGWVVGGRNGGSSSAMFTATIYPVALTTRLFARAGNRSRGGSRRKQLRSSN